MDRHACALAALLAALTGVGPAHAAFPGDNGRIAYSGWTHREGYAGTYDIYTINPDGTDRRQLTTHDDQDSTPSWSSDGRKIVYERASSIRAVDVDGSNDRQVSIGADGSNESSPGWSPDGSRVVYDALRGPGSTVTRDLFVMNDDGSQSTRLFTNYVQDANPSWSPDGAQIAFDRWTGSSNEIHLWDGWKVTLVTAIRNANGPRWSPDGSRLAFAAWDGDYEIYTIRVDGTDLRKVTDNSSADGTPEWSPDGAKIVYTSADSELHVVNPDGSDDTNVTNTPGVPEGQPSWQPVRVETTPYVRPAGASPLRVPLVPAYPECTEHTRIHGPPLAYGSCPVDPPSRTATVGTPDANGAPAQSSGYVRLTFMPGARVAPPDDTDVKVAAQVTDIHCTPESSACGSFNWKGGYDYVGEAQLRIGLRLTDGRNGRLYQESGTVSDTTLDFEMDCVASDSTGLGSSCQTLSSFNAIAPGLAGRHVRTIAEFGAVNVYDGGPDGLMSTADGNERFLTQGIFVP